MLALHRIGLVIVILVITACSDVKRGEGVGKYGMMAENTPEYTAVMFLYAIYREPNLDNAMALSSERMKRLLNNYRTNRNAQRHLIGLSYDTVEINPDGGDTVGRTEFSKKADVTVFLSGFYQEDKIDELRTIKLVKEGGDWKVNDVETDPFL